MSHVLEVLSAGVGSPADTVIGLGIVAIALVAYLLDGVARVVVRLAQIRRAHR